ncbi:MAG: protease modulator HflC [Planctomycetia bacterium]|nr:protease modulator HflC [Planctomycetia bacterium]
MSEHHHHHHHHASDPENRLSPAAFVFRVVVSLLIVAMLIANGMTFQVSETENVIVTRFDNPIRTVSEPGLHFKLPWPIDRTHSVDIRKRIFSTPHVQVVTKDNKSVIIIAYMVWEVDEPLQFLKSLGDVEAAQKSLQTSVINQVNVMKGKYDLSAFVSTDASQIKTDEVEAQICENIEKEVGDKFGVHVVQVGIQRIALPEENSTAIINSMRQDRDKEIGILREQGQLEVTKIQNEAAKLASATIERGNTEAQAIRSRAENEAAAIRAQTQNINPKFYEFWRKMEAMRRTISDRTTLILRNDNALFGPLFEMPKLDEAKANIQPSLETLPALPLITPTTEGLPPVDATPAPAPAGPTSPAAPIPAPAALPPLNPETTPDSSALWFHLPPVSQESAEYAIRALKRRG